PGEITAVARTGIQVGCGTGSLRLTRVQLNRGKGQPVRVVDAINGYPGLFVAGLRFQDEASQQ
ncbi:MAG: hypothetical protein O7G86_05780, partial [Gammaproteobacteria bacterium]|nr:hypothetical protein [Gammaproteobacteria bacterium]